MIEYRVGDVRDRLAEIPDGSVDLVTCSPPFLALRSYLPEGHESKHAEIGSEPTPAAFLSTLLGLTDEWRRILAPHGSIAIELGDTFSGSGGAGGDYNEGGLRDGQQAFEGSARKVRVRTDGGQYGNHPGRGGTKHNAETRPPQPGGRGWPLAKSLCGLPTLYAWSLAYGRNLLDPSHTIAPWRVRNVIVWARPNPAVGCVDNETEALTPHGWKRHHELRDGDLIAAYDAKTDTCRFLPAKFVRWQRENEPMIAIEKRKTSQRLTLDHRCLVRTRKRPEPFVVLAADLRNDQQLLLSAPLEEVPGPEPVTPERAELLGWFITEGSVAGRRSLIRQSLTNNRPKVERIRALLVAEEADFSESNYRRSSGKYGGHVLTTFTVRGELAAWLNQHHKRLPMEYATTWPTRTLSALFDGLIDGDGHRRKAGGLLFFQKERQVCDAVQVVALRLGYRASLTRQEPMDGWQVSSGNEEHHDSSRWVNVIKWDQPAGSAIPTEAYTGTVWCPMVETSFWLARRNGRTFVTGNSLGDKYRPATSYITVACVSDKRWFDLDAVRTSFTGHGGAGTGARKGQAGAQGHDNRPDGMPRWLNTHAGAPPLDHWTDDPTDPDDGDLTWKLSTEGSSIKVPVTTVVPCGPDDGGVRTTSPGCPVHGDRVGSAPTESDGGPQVDPGQSLRTPRTDDGREQAPQAAASDGASTGTDSGAPATPHSTASNRTDHVPSTSRPDTPFARTADGTARTSESPESFETDPDTPESSNGAACPPVDEPETAPRSDHSSGQESACTCSFHLHITTEHSHYAMWPSTLAARLIDSMCPREVCRECGVARRRISGGTTYIDAKGRPHEPQRWASGIATAGAHTLKPDGGITAVRLEGGWSDCGHGDNYRPGLVLDPFAGTGTTLAVAEVLGRDAIGIDLDHRNRDLYPRRLAEVRRKLNPTAVVTIPGQGSIFDELDASA